MEPSHDNPLVRFAAFWWGVGVILLFALVLIIVRLTVGGDGGVDPLEQEAALQRYKVRSTVDTSQQAALSWTPSEDGETVQAPPAAVYQLVGGQLLSSAPVAVEDPAQWVGEGLPPGSDGEVDFAAVDAMTPGPGTTPDAEMMAKGQMQYALCMACHGANGEGGPIAPPLANSNLVAGPVSNLIRIQLRGLNRQNNYAAPMAAMGAASSDEDVAAVLTYVRNSFGNSAPPVLPAQAEALRSEVGKPWLTQDDLLPFDN